MCSGRTDAGVHATGQVAHVDLPADFDGDLARAVNRQLAPRIVVSSATVTSDDFDARRSATSRHYRYLVWNAAAPDPLLAGLSWHVAEPLEVKAMAAAADPLLGEHDFRAFCRRPPGRPATDPIVRLVKAASWRRVPSAFVSGVTPDADLRPGSGGSRDNGVWEADADAGALLRFDVVAGSFCHQMVRSIVAVLVDAGRGRATAATVMELLGAGTRTRSPQPAPPHGLCLVGVGFGRPLG